MTVTNLDASFSRRGQKRFVTRTVWFILSDPRYEDILDELVVKHNLACAVAESALADALTDTFSRKPSSC